METPEMPYSSREKCPCEDPGRDAGRGQGRLLEDLQHRGPEDAARAQARGDHRRRIGELAAKYQGTYPAAAKILLTDREGLTAYLRFPAGHHHRIRHSN